MNMAFSFSLHLDALSIKTGNLSAEQVKARNGGKEKLEKKTADCFLLSTCSNAI